MFTLTSTSTKLAVLAFSAAVSMASFQSVALSFQTPDNHEAVAQLPTVFIVGKRDSLATNSVQTANKVTNKVLSKSAG